jgi:hypothetical protein
VIFIEEFIGNVGLQISFETMFLSYTIGDLEFNPSLYNLDEKGFEVL